MDLCARDIMTRDVICVLDDMDLRDLTRLFLEKRISGAPVLDQDGDLVGVVSVTDLVYYTVHREDELWVDSSFYELARMEGRRLPKGFQVEDANSGSVKDIMTPVVHAVNDAVSLHGVADAMTKAGVHRLIVRRGTNLVGIISALDVIRALAKAAPRDGPKAATKARPKAKVAAKAKPKAKVVAKAKPRAKVEAKAKPKAKVEAKAKPKARPGGKKAKKA